MARRLTNMKINRVDLVDAGANQKAHIVLAKRAIVKDSPTVSSVHVDAPMGDERDEYEKATLSSEHRNSLPDSAFAAVWTDAQGKKQRKLPFKSADGSIDHGHLQAALGRVDGTGAPSDIKASARKKLEAAVNHKEKRMPSTWKELLKRAVGLASETDVEKRNREASAIIKAADELPDEIAKVAHDPADKNCKCADCMKKDDGDEMSKNLKAIEKKHADELVAVNKRNDELAAQIEVEKNLRLDREMVDVLKSFKMTPLNIDLADPKNDVKKFREMKKSSPEAYERTIEVLKSQDALLADSAMTKSFGTSRSGGTGNAWGEIEAKAAELVSKSSAKMTKEQAIEVVMFQPENQELVKRYRAEQH